MSQKVVRHDGAVLVDEFDRVDTRPGQTVARLRLPGAERFGLEAILFGVFSDTCFILVTSLLLWARILCIFVIFIVIYVYCRIQ